jgi:hypothetical protein
MRSILPAWCTAGRSWTSWAEKLVHKVNGCWSLNPVPTTKTRGKDYPRLPLPLERRVMACPKALDYMLARLQWRDYS